jgi:hypothetical protein
MTAMVAFTFKAVSIIGRAGGMNMISETDKRRRKNI